MRRDENKGFGYNSFFTGDHSRESRFCDAGRPQELCRDESAIIGINNGFYGSS
jgi:hypothetical protein